MRVQVLAADLGLFNAGNPVPLARRADEPTLCDIVVNGETRRFVYAEVFQLQASHRTLMAELAVLRTAMIPAERPAIAHMINVGGVLMNDEALHHGGVLIEGVPALAEDDPRADQGRVNPLHVAPVDTGDGIQPLNGRDRIVTIEQELARTVFLTEEIWAWDVGTILQSLDEASTYALLPRPAEADNAALYATFAWKHIIRAPGTYAGLEPLSLWMRVKRFAPWARSNYA